MSQSITLDDFYALFRESERQRQETERLLRQSLEISRQEFDRRIAKTERIAAQANEAVNNLSKLISI